MTPEEKQNHALYWKSWGCVGGTKDAEYRRTIDMIPQIFAEHGKNGTYFVLAFLYDSQYSNEDLKAMMDLCKPKDYTRTK